MTILLDLTSLCNLLRKGRWPHGVPRVGLKYMAHYQNHAQCLLRIGSYTRILSPKNSKKIFAILTKWRPQDFWKILGIWLSDYITNWGKHSPSLLIKTDLSGFDTNVFKRLQKKYPSLCIVATIHDLFPIFSPELGPLLGKEFGTRIMGILQQAHFVSLVSQQTQAQYLEFYERYNIPPQKYFVNALASGLKPDRSLRPHVLPVPYFVCIGSVTLRKNQRLLLQIWQRMQAQLQDQCPRLILIGKLHTDCLFSHSVLKKCQTLQNVVSCMSVSDTDMHRYLLGAQAALMPNLSEGYGLPLIEALTLGTPVIASDIPIFREVGGEIPDFIDPLDTLRWMEQILEYTKPDSPVRKAQLARLEHFTPPSWEAHFARLEAQIGSPRLIAADTA